MASCHALYLAAVLSAMCLTVPASGKCDMTLITKCLIPLAKYLRFDYDAASIEEKKQFCKDMKSAFDCYAPKIDNCSGQVETDQIKTNQSVFQMVQTSLESQCHGAAQALKLSWPLFLAVLVLSFQLPFARV